jgi:DNA-binding NarL/FixJ family response regulator
VIIDETQYLAHYGILRKSGRYPWGSGGTAEKRSKDFFDHVSNLRKQGLSDTDIARGFGMTTTEFRRVSSIAKNAKRAADVAQANRLADAGMSNNAIGREMGINESSVRALRAAGVKEKLDVLHTTANMLKDQVEQKKYLDVGAGVEYHLGVSRDKLDTAIAVLKDQGYQIHYVKKPQLGTHHETTYKVLVAPGTPYSETLKNSDKITQVTTFSENGGRTYLGIHPPLSIDSKRIAVRYAEDGGKEADGVIFVRRGVDDVSIGAGNYAQVRISVDGTHYLKGMAMYKDDMPPGIDLVFNSNKSNTGNKHDAFKPLKTDKEGAIKEDNPFGSVIRQRLEVGADGKTRVTSVMNMVGGKEGSGEEGSWARWNKSLSSQFLSKQEPKLAKEQLAMTFERKKSELNEILALTNPAIRRVLLDKFAEDVDAAAVHLKAAHLPRQSTHVILPLATIKETEIYAPRFRNGERVVLVRHPHSGVFEIPELVVNNRHPEGIALLGKDAEDAVGIHHSVAEKLSGADFDGDTVLVIPNNKGAVRTAPSLAGLKGFDAKARYPKYDGMEVMKPSQTQAEMGKISNLITDMTIKKANNTELAAAVRHSMVVIDAEKHELNYKQSALDNNIAHLKEKYQGGRQRGASTLISRKGQTLRVPERKQGFKVDPNTGEKIYRETGESFVGRTGKTVVKTTTVSRLGEARNAHDLSSGTAIEKVYADHSNRLKSLANEARLRSVHTPSVRVQPSAKTHYSEEVKDLNARLRLALRNAPLERQAQVLANTFLAAQKQANPEMDKAELRKIKGQVLTEARTRVGAGKDKIVITEKEWAAIQAGALSNHQLTQILKNADLDQVKKLATPKTPKLMTSTKQARAKSMLAAGYTQTEVADQLGVSLTTLKTSLSDGG